MDASDYIEQLTYLLFLKMADELGGSVPKGYDWKSLVKKDEGMLLPHLESILLKLKSQKGILGDIFAEPVSRVRNAKILKALIDEINSINWTTIDVDIVGITFEELIGKVANEGKKGAGQYFTPRPLIRSIVNVMKPNPIENKNFKIGDVAVGTAGFLVIALEWFKERNNLSKLSSNTHERIISNTYFGQELVQRPRRLALMNMYLHGISASIKLGDTIYDQPEEMLFDCILTNPPFGNKGANQIPQRNFPIKTSDKQLNFVQHIIERLKQGGRAAIVLPDSCLNSDTAKKMWAFYLDINRSRKSVCNVHTVLKLPEGVFAAYANGVKACVIFLQKGIETRNLWVYDARRDTLKITTKSNALSHTHFDEFEKCYGADPNGNSSRTRSDRFRAYSLKEIQHKGYDISFVEVAKPQPIRHPLDIIDEMIADYEKKISALRELKTKIPSSSHGNSKALGKGKPSGVGVNS